jgi:ERCC4-related helicase
MSFVTGSLVATRGREWVVLPGSDDDFLMLRPLGGSDDEVTGVLTALEDVAPAAFELPTPDDLGDERSARLLLDALRLGFRSSAGPFRCFGRLAFEPRAYQLVPLLMALRLSPVRLLIADDVGTGKTASALLVAAELMAQGDADRLAVLCPPHLATQWQAEMSEKFKLDAELVLPATASRLERGCRVDETLFQHHDVTVVSTEFIKSDRRREEFLRTAPELVIVDEAHTAASAPGEGRARHQRHELVAGLAADPRRHVVLVTATPHSGNEEAFRSLLALLDPSFAELPEDLSGDRNQATRRRLARHLVQRRRADLRAFFEDTRFPDRMTREETYSLSPDYRRLYEGVLSFSSETVASVQGGDRERRIRWWSVLSLLRALASSPAAAAETLRKRAQVADESDVAGIEELGHQLVLDLVDEGDTEGADIGLGADFDETANDSPARRRLLDMARAADALKGRDPKFDRLAMIVGDLVADGWHPIVFCRFIATAHYVADALRTAMPGVEVAAVTGAVPVSERPGQVGELAAHDRRVLVATDCLSEGINLQASFDAVVHYDLSWNPTRHEQREGRVDRLGQPRDTVRVVTLYGSDNRIDTLVLDVLLRKHEAIRNSLGVSIPVPGDPNQIVGALVEGMFARGLRLDEGEQLAFEGLSPKEMGLLEEWDRAADRERRSRTVFAQEAIKASEVQREVEEARAAVGTHLDVRRFVTDAVRAHEGTATGDDPARLSLVHAPDALVDAVGGVRELEATFGGVTLGTERVLNRADPFVAGLASFVLDSALDSETASPARRAGVIRSDAVSVLTTLLLVRYRFDLQRHQEGRARQLLVEDSEMLGFTGAPTEPTWLELPDVERLVAVTSSRNIAPELARDFIARVLDAAPVWSAHLDDAARTRADSLLDSHQRVRQAVGQTTASWRIEPHLPADVLGIYVVVPSGRP